MKQNIGGMLMCEAVHITDLHIAQCDINYYYKIDDQLIDFGVGCYFRRPWNKDEQLIRFKNWLLLKTGGRGSYDVIIILDLITKKITTFEFTSQNIENDTLWKAEKVKSLLNYCCDEVFIDSIKNGEIIIHYNFRTSEELTEEYDSRKLYYKINAKTGIPALSYIEKQ